MAMTDIGYLPEGWDAVKLLDCCELINGLSYSPENVKDRGLLVLRSSNVQDGKLVFDDNVYVDCFVDDRKLVKKDDIIICVRNGSAKLLGKCAIATRDYPHTIGAFMAVLRGASNEYIIQVLQRGNIQRDILANSGATINQITNKDFKSIQIPYPKEQSERDDIADILSDLDSLIIKLELLIAKKRSVKKGAMQELLSGEKRLPGFNGEWVEMTIGKYGYLQKGSINPQTQPEEYFSEYSMPAYDEKKQPSNTQGKDMHSNRTVIKGKTLLFNKLNVRLRRIWLIEQCEDNAVCSSEFLPYCSEEINLHLLSQILFTDKVTEDFIGMSTGTSNSQKRISPKAFLDYTLYLPVDPYEQEALAELFEDMDKEISSLEKELVKYRDLKSGMMECLLTGQVRLKRKEN